MGPHSSSVASRHLHGCAMLCSSAHSCNPCGLRATRSPAPLSLSPPLPIALRAVFFAPCGANTKHSSSHSAPMAYHKWEVLRTSSADCFSLSLSPSLPPVCLVLSPLADAPAWIFLRLRRSLHATSWDYYSVLPEPTSGES